MSSPESREARQRRMKRQAQGSKDSIAYRKKRRAGKEFHATLVEDDRWSEDYKPDEIHDEEYYLEGEHELDFDDDRTG